ncbi:lactate utilization protein C [Nocardioides sp. KR10-350]|uniref:LutC/YkgG family protein n=1 Tax=Nocardioides cheoyonin TaxID=3156615 RepID=UPI0032B3F304
MSAREEILGRVSGALSGVPRSAPGAAPRPAYAAGADVADVPALFVERVEDYKAVVTRVSGEGVAGAVAEALGGARRIVVPGGLEPAWLAGLEGGLDGVEVVTDDGTLTSAQLNELDGVVTGAAVGIAVTGTIVLDHGADQGRRALSLVPDLHVCVIREDQLVGDVPEGVGRLSAAVADGRPLTWISGPSATSDIELERVEGVHGPRTLHVVLVG